MNEKNLPSGKDVRPVPKGSNLTGKEAAALVKSQWDERAAVLPKDRKSFKVSVAIPRTTDSLAVSNLDIEDNVVKVWLNDNISGEPDYVIVNPPTEVVTSQNVTVTDPLGAIAQVINGVQK